MAGRRNEPKREEELDQPGWEFRPAIKMPHFISPNTKCLTKQRENLGSLKFSYIPVFLICEMVEKVNCHWEYWFLNECVSSIWKVFFILAHRTMVFHYWI